MPTRATPVARRHGPEIVHLTPLARRHAPEILLLAVLAAWSVASALGGETMALEDGRAVPPRLDLALAFMPQSWPTLAALLWAPLVVWRGRRKDRRPAPLLIRGALLLAVALIGGVAVGVAWTWATGRPVAVGEVAVLPLLLATMLTLYLFASALIVATGRFWTGVLTLMGTLMVIHWLVGATGWGPLAGLWRWITVGHLGPGTMMETPGIAAGVVLETEWTGISPWPPVLLWLSLAAASAGGALYWRRRGEDADSPASA